MSDPLRGDPVDTSAYSYEDRVRACIARLENTLGQLNHNGNYLVSRDLIDECCGCLYEYLAHPEPTPADLLLR